MRDKFEALGVVLYPREYVDWTRYANLLIPTRWSGAEEEADRLPRGSVGYVADLDNRLRGLGADGHVDGEVDLLLPARAAGFLR